MRLLRKALFVFREEGLAMVASMTWRKLLHVLRLKRIRGPYPYRQLADVSAIDPFDPSTIPAPALRADAHGSLRLRWYMPEPGRGSGGHRSLFLLIDELARRGHSSEVAVIYGRHMGKSREDIRAFIRRHFNGTDVPVVWDSDEQADVDVVVASFWRSAYIAATDTHCALRAYLVLDWEPDFYPRGSEQIFAQNSYRLGFHHVTAGPWIASRLRNEGFHADYFHLPADQSQYYPDPEPGAPENHVVFYGRPFTARRCFEMGCEALRLLDQELGKGRLLVTMVGADIPPFDAPFRTRWLGIASHDQLRRLYSSAGAVVVLSATNTSLVPLEAALCAAPVVDLDVPSVSGTLEDGVSCRLAPPSPAAIARVVADVLRDREGSHALGLRAREHALQLSWAAAGAEIEAALRRALAADVRRLEAGRGG